MGIFTRITDILSANLNSMLDNAENPEKMVNQLIREMEDTLVEVKSNAARVIADRKTLERHISYLKNDQLEWEKKAELAVSKGRDDLATLALQEKLKKQNDEDKLKSEMASTEAAIDKFKEDISKLEAKMKEAKAKKKSLIMRRQAAENRRNIQNKLHRASNNSALQKFEQFERRIESLEGEVDAFDSKNPDLEAEFEKLENEDLINKELATLKARMGKTEDKKEEPKK